MAHQLDDVWDDWQQSVNMTAGELERWLESDAAQAGGRTVRASEDDPQYLVTSEKSGGEAVHKPDALHKD